MDNQSYSAALARLENIVEKMQAPDCDIDNLAAYTAEALGLLKFCKEKLTTTDTEIRRCLDELNGTAASAARPDTTDDEELPF